MKQSNAVGPRSSNLSTMAPNHYHIQASCLNDPHQHSCSVFSGIGINDRQREYWFGFWETEEDREEPYPIFFHLFLSPGLSVARHLSISIPLGVLPLKNPQSSVSKQPIIFHLQWVSPSLSEGNYQLWAIRYVFLPPPNSPFSPSNVWNQRWLGRMFEQCMMGTCRALHWGR